MFGMVPYRKSNNTPTVFDPFRELEELEKFFFRGNPIGECRADISEDEKAYILEADLPGIKKDDIHIDINDDSLVISAERKNESEEKKENYIRRERTFGSICRSFDISGVKADEIRASFENGVLKLVMPKKEASLPSSRRLEIE